MTTLYSFCAETNCADGSEPSAGQLVQATDGNFYGTTQSGPHPDHSEIASFSSTTSPMTALSSSTDRSFTVCILNAPSAFYTLKAVQCGGAVPQGNAKQVYLTGLLSCLFEKCLRRSVCTERNGNPAGLPAAAGEPWEPQGYKSPRHERASGNPALPVLLRSLCTL